MPEVFPGTSDDEAIDLTVSPVLPSYRKHPTSVVSPQVAGESRCAPCFPGKFCTIVTDDTLMVADTLHILKVGAFRQAVPK